ncbi:hypothetical protein LCGC14_0518720 [marine sediment metagenome]
MGCLTALNLVQAGLSVTLVERQNTGKEASWAGGGIVSPLYPWRYNDAVSALVDWSQRYYPQLGAELCERTGIDPEVTPCGLLWLDDTEQEQALSWAAAHHKPLQKVDAAFLHDQVPALACRFTGGLWQSGLANVRNPRLMTALKALLLQNPLFTLEENSIASELTMTHGRVTGVRHARGELMAGAVILTAGAWSGEWMERLGLDLPVVPVKGQMLLYKAEPGWLPSMVLYNGRYAIPRRDGHIVIGSTLEHCGFDTSTTDEALGLLRQSAEGLLPGLAQMQPVAQWAGLRPGSPEGVPYIGRVPERPGLWINAGHYRNGLVLAPASCRLIADLMTDNQPAIDPAPYQLEGRVDSGAG